MEFVAIFILFSTLSLTESQVLIGLTENICRVEEMRSDIKELKEKNQVLTAKADKMQDLLDFLGHGYVSINGDVVYLVVRKEMSWNDAWDFCRQRNSILADLSDQDQNDFVKRLVRRDVWIGGYRLQNDWYWKTTTGNKPINYTDWAPGEPNNDGVQECIQLSRSASSKWDDDGCANLKRFVCSKIM